ncbi:MAG: hypothetical protein EOP48_26915 [Sphingobacteriales bacterium]|nr:MAG: hypothetical protein EOP48_26915 [Sphingobacteriales bacterium]
MLRPRAADCIRDKGIPDQRIDIHVYATVDTAAGLFKWTTRNWTEVNPLRKSTIPHPTLDEHRLP